MLLRPFPTALALAAMAQLPCSAQLGLTYCAGVPNSTGNPAALTASGSVVLSSNNLLLGCAGLPQGSNGYFVRSDTRGLVPGAGGGVGTLCLGGAVGRYTGSVVQAPASGQIAMAIDLTSLPGPTGSFGATVGNPLCFQFWYRDALPGGATTSNFSSAIEVTAHCGAGTRFHEQQPMGSTGGHPQAGDIDGDGWTDLVASNGLQAEFSVYRGDGAGGFGPEERHPSAPHAKVVGLTDVDGNGTLDVVLLGGSPTSVIVSANLGFGNFAVPRLWPVSFSPELFVHLDADGDGDRDFVVASVFPFNQQLRLCKNDGLGDFSDQQFIPFASQFYGLAAGDLDGDGDDELLVTVVHSTHGEEIFLGTPGAPFATSTHLPTPWRAAHVTVGDVDSDGALDLVLKGEVTPELAVWRNMGGLQFSLAQSLPNELGWEHSTLADMDGDGAPEIVTNAAGALRIFRNIGAATFAPPESTQVGNVFLREVLPMHLDADPHIDLVSANGTTITISRGHGGLSLGGPDAYTDGRVSNQVELADVDGDAIDDLILLNGPFTHVSARRGRPNGTFDAAVELEIGYLCSQLECGDLDGDGVAEILLANNSLGGLTIVRYDATPALVSSGVTGGAERLNAFAVDDVDGDGLGDLVALLNNNRLMVRHNQGGGVFSPPTILACTSGFLPDLDLEDMNADGWLDIVVAGGGNGPVSVFENDQQGAFTFRFGIDFGTFVNGIAVGDVDGNGRLDIAVTDYTQREVHVLLSAGGMSFQQPTSHALPAPPFGIAIFDHDDDSLADIVVCAEGICALHNLGWGTSFALSQHASLDETNDLAVEDLEGDGILDVIIGYGDSSGAGVHFNRCR
jgi:hypothetical protein